MKALALALTLLFVVAFARAALADDHLEGTTVDYCYDAKDVHDPDRAWWARAYLHPSVLGEPDIPRPLVVYLHGINKRFVKYPWMGRAGPVDLRAKWDRYLRQGMIAPAVLAAPSTIMACKLPQALWTAFDLDRFLAHTIRATRGQVRIDLEQIIVVGHSGAGCNHRGGLVTALQATVPLRAGLVIDVCMDESDAAPLSLAHPDMDLVVTYQRKWRRDFDCFTRRFLEESRSRGATGLRRVEEIPLGARHPHTVIVPRSLEAWLPRWLPPTTRARPSGARGG